MTTSATCGDKTEMTQGPALAARPEALGIAAEHLDSLKAAFPGWLIEPRRFLDGWNICAWQHGTSTTGRMPDITRATKVEIRAAIIAFISGQQR